MPCHILGMRSGQIETFNQISDDVLNICDTAGGRVSGPAVPDRMIVMSICEDKLWAGLIVSNIPCHVASGPVKINIPYVEVLANMREDRQKPFDQKALGTIERYVPRLNFGEFRSEEVENGGWHHVSNSGLRRSVFWSLSDPADIQSSARPPSMTISVPSM